MASAGMVSQGPVLSIAGRRQRVVSHCGFPPHRRSRQHAVEALRTICYDARPFYGTTLST